MQIQRRKIKDSDKIVKMSDWSTSSFEGVAGIENER